MITNAIIWNHRGRVGADGKAQLEVRVTVDRKSYYFGTGIRCLQSEFAAGQVVNCPGASEMNNRLAIIYTKVLACVNACVDKNVGIDVESIRREVWKTVEEHSDEPVFLNWVAEQIPMLSISDGTRKHYEPLQTRLEAFGKIRRWQDVTVENIVSFDSYLHTVTKPISDADRKRGVKPKKLSDAGIYNYHKCLKALLNRADSFGKIERNPYERLRGQFKRGDRENVEYLTEDEMRAFEELQLPVGSALDIAHDLFVFQMYTGLPYSDAQAFKISDYKWDGQSWNHIGERIKTGVPYVSRLLSPAVAILEKYGWEIPKMDNRVYNHHLKALLNRADSFGKIERNPYERLRGQFKRGDRENVEYLTEDEMRAFEELQLPVGSALDIAHDLFIFQMYTGLPYSDAQAFKISDYKWDGQSWNHIGERIKTGVPYVSRLLSPAVAILEKYGWEIPKMDNRVYNHHLKALGQMAGIKTNLHTHLARHTFATFMLRNGAKIENVSRMLGHTNIVQTQRYAKVLAKSVHDDFETIEHLFTK